MLIGLTTATVPSMDVPHVEVWTETAWGWVVVMIVTV